MLCDIIYIYIVTTNVTPDGRRKRSMCWISSSTVEIKRNTFALAKSDKKKNYSR